jgi:general secretion pathway protein D
MVNKRHFFFTLSIVYCLSTCPGLLAALDDESTRTPLKKRSRGKQFSFNYTNTPLVDVINELSSLLDYNIILPQGTAIAEKVTLHLDREYSLKEAWNILLTILDEAEYTVVPKKNIYTIVKNSKDVGREPLRLFVNTNYDQLPATDERIRYLYYLVNLKATGQSDDELTPILKILLPDDAVCKVDPAANAIVIVAQAIDIKAAMKIIVQLDQPGFQEKMEFIRLKSADAKMVADLFNQNILKTNQPVQPRHLDAKNKNEGTYFSQHTRIIADERSNALIVLGRNDAVDRIKDFIFEYIDVELETGKSILHAYELQYLNAEEFAPVLQQIVQSGSSGGTGQAKGAPELQKGGTERFFNNVIVKTDTIPLAEGQQNSTRYYGGNKLIIAATNEDWKRIKKLIEEMDIPQRQVFIEILVADLTVDDTRQLGSLLRNPAKIPMPGEIGFQSAQLAPGQLPNSFDNPQTISVLNNNTNYPTVSSDLLRDSIDSSGNKSDAGTLSPAKLLAPGSTAISLSDNNGSTWSLLQVLRAFDNTKILSHPHIIAVHNQKATVEIGQTRLVTGEATGNINPIVKNDTIKAFLKVNITPKISSADTINVQVDIDIDEFLAGVNQDNNARATRTVQTNANIKNKGVLALGGLIRDNKQKSLSETPFLGRIPILGYFFKTRTGTLTKNNLTVFISPTIIEPRYRAGAGQYTRDYIKLATEYGHEGELFDSLQDPITRWYFKSSSDARESVEDFIKKDITQLKGGAGQSGKMQIYEKDFASEGGLEPVNGIKPRVEDYLETPKSEEEEPAPKKKDLLPGPAVAQNRKRPAQRSERSEPVLAKFDPNFDKERYARELRQKVQQDTTA